MTEKQLLRLMSTAFDGFVEDCLRPKRRSLARQITAGVSVAACAALVVGALFLGGHFTREPSPVVPTGTGEVTVMEEPVTNDSETDTDHATEETTGNQAGGTDFCKVHCEEYHSIMGQLRKYVDKDLISKWGEEQRKNNNFTNCPDDECPMTTFTIKRFIDDFNVSKENFEEACANSFDCIHSADLLYSNNMEAIDEYYSNIEARKKTIARQTQIRQIKDTILSKYNDNTKRYNISIIELINKHNVPKSELLQIIETVYENRIYDYKFDYLVDQLYDGSIITTDEKGNILEVHEQDAAFCGIDNWYTD